MNDTTTRSLTDILADLNTAATASLSTYRELANAVRAQLAPLPEGEAEQMAAEAAHAARTTAPPVPGVTRHNGYIVRAAVYLHPHTGGLLETWLVACEDAEHAWVTWEAYNLDHPGREGQLAYNAGHYFQSPTRACRDGLNRRRALADLTERAGLLPDMARLAADAMTSSPYTTPETARAARGVRKYFS